VIGIADIGLFFRNFLAAIDVAYIGLLESDTLAQI
jgi:hypothetical protein